MYRDLKNDSLKVTQILGIDTTISALPFYCQTFLCLLLQFEK